MAISKVSIHLYLMFSYNGIVTGDLPADMVNCLCYSYQFAIHCMMLGSVNMLRVNQLCQIVANFFSLYNTACVKLLRGCQAVSINSV